MDKIIQTAWAKNSFWKSSDIFTRLFAKEVIPKGFNLKWTLSLGSNGGGDNNINKKTAAELREESIKKKHKLNQSIVSYPKFFNTVNSHKFSRAPYVQQKYSFTSLSPKLK